ncbi:MAG: hypothetical protein LBB16_02895, partial [Puniceicoccales bacterium]|nr:hypothetical protein [Puniceicoccales bacterium]
KESLLARLSSEDSKTLADRLLSSDSTLLIALIDEGALPNLEFSDKMRLLATEISTIHPAFERGIARGFFGRDSVDASAWKTIVDARENISLQVARKVWQNISNEMARYCFGQDGNIDTNRVEALMLFLEQDSFFTQTPFRYIPLVSHMRSQMHEICERLLDDTNSVRSKLNEVNSFFGSQGASIIQTMSMGRTPPLSYSEAILASLFTPHRQSSLPTCSINSLINEEIFNHPERLVQMYKQILSNGQYTFPSGHTVQPRPIEGGYVTVDLKHGGSGRNEIFKYIKGRDPAKIATQIARWREEGILYDQSSNGHTNYELRLPVHNLNDLLFADLVEASNFGRQRTIGIDLSFNFDTASVYAGRSGYFTVYKKWISVSDTNIQDTISKLQRHAHRQSNSGNCYMRVSTHSTDATSGGGHDHSWHSENLYIKDLIALNLDDLLLGQVYPIGDRNWEGDAGEKNIPQLVVKKVNDTPPSYEFGILRGDSFEKNI